MRRRTFIGAAALPLLAACGAAATPTPAPAAKPTEAAKPAEPAKPFEPPKPNAAPPTPTAVPAKPAEPTATVRPRDASMTSPDFSVHVFLWGGFETTQRDLNLVKELGFGWIKQRFEWRYIEPHIKGKMEWNEPDRIVDAVTRAGLKMIARVDNQPRWARADTTWPIDGPPDKLSDFGDFLEAMAKRYQGRIQAYQIWNEPNLAREWGNKPPNPAAYVEMLKVAHKAVKSADPNAVVISGGLSPTTATGAIAMPDVQFVKELYAAGGKPFFDLLGVHAAGYKAPPELSPEEIAKDPKYNHGEGAAGRIYGFRHAEDLRAVMVANGDANKRVAVLEFGWTADTRPSSPYFWHAVSEDEKAAYLVRAFEFAKKNWQPWIGPMSVIYIADPTWTKEHEQFYWSITDPNGALRPAFKALQGMSKEAPAAPLVLTGQQIAGTPVPAGTKPAGATPAAPATPRPAGPTPTRPVATP
jgi:hypothetical protein